MERYSSDTGRFPGLRNRQSRGYIRGLRPWRVMSITKNTKRSGLLSATCGQFRQLQGTSSASVRDALDGRVWCADRRTGQRLDRMLGLGGVHHPGSVEVEGALGDPLVSLAGGQHAGVAAVQELEKVVLRLPV